MDAAVASASEFRSAKVNTNSSIMMNVGTETHESVIHVRDERAVDGMVETPAEPFVTF